MDFLFKHKTKIALGVGIIYILYGIAGGIFKFNVRNSIFDNASFILMILVIYLYFGGRNRNTQATKTDEQKDEINEISDSPSAEKVDIRDKEVENEVKENSETNSKPDKE